MRQQRMSMRLFVWSQLFTIVITILIVRIVSPIVQRPHEPYSLPAHKTLYLERGIDNDEIYYIISAAIEWYETTNGQVVFDIKKLPQSNIDPSDAVIVINGTPDYPEIILLDNQNNSTTLAFYNGGILPYIILLEGRIADIDFSAVVMHEMGHSLGLNHPNTPEHPEIGIDTLMYSTIDTGSRHITQTDLKQFCRLYHCDWKKFHLYN